MCIWFPELIGVNKAVDFHIGTFGALKLETTQVEVDLMCACD